MVIAVGSLFSNIFCRTYDVAGETKKIVHVPLAYANKEKFIVRLQQDPGMQEDNQILLPRLSYEITGFDYDSMRQHNKVNKVVSTKDNRTVYSFAPVPYTITFNVYSFTRTNEDNLQIMEQIIPYFTPDLNLSVKVLQNPDVTQDCSLTLNSVTTDDSYDGAFEDRRYIITTYTLQLKMNYYGPLLGSFDPENHFQNGDASSVIKSVKTNLNTLKYSAVVDPFEANATDPYTVVEGWSTRTPPTDFDTDVTL